MLLGEMQAVNAKLRLETSVSAVTHDGARFRVTTSGGVIEAESLIVATGGKSIPKMGATGFAYQIAEQFGLKLIETRPGLRAADTRSRLAGKAEPACRCGGSSRGLSRQDLV